MEKNKKQNSFNALFYVCLINYQNDNKSFNIRLHIKCLSTPVILIQYLIIHYFPIMQIQMQK